MSLDKNFWDSRYKTNTIGWDIGYVSTPLKEYIDQLTDKNQKILIPGAGNSYEAEYLHSQGFKNVFILDFSKTALQNFLSRVPSFPKNHIILENFFDFKGSFDLIIEQTFFCALDPKLRPKYAQQMHQLLVDNGKLVGVLFCIELNKDKPPFGGSKEEYLPYFEPYFHIKKMEPAYNSIPPRKDSELFITLVKK